MDRLLPFIGQVRHGSLATQDGSWESLGGKKRRWMQERSGVARSSWVQVMAAASPGGTGGRGGRGVGPQRCPWKPLGTYPGPNPLRLKCTRSA